jgi:hypothetical protein
MSFYIFSFRWDLTKYPTTPVTQQLVRKYINFGEFVYEKVDASRVLTNDLMKDLMKPPKRS